MSILMKRLDVCNTLSKPNSIDRDHSDWRGGGVGASFITFFPFFIFFNSLILLFRDPGNVPPYVCSYLLFQYTAYLFTI